MNLIPVQIYRAIESQFALVDASSDPRFIAACFKRIEDLHWIMLFINDCVTFEEYLLKDKSILEARMIAAETEYMVEETLKRTDLK